MDATAIDASGTADSHGSAQADARDDLAATPPDGADAGKDLGIGTDTPAPPPCAATDCNDDDPCTDDSCTPVDGCVHLPAAHTCADGDACTIGEHCASGACVLGGKADCDDGKSCTEDACDSKIGCLHLPLQASCTDGNLCTIGDACDQGVCLPGPATGCDDGNPCTDDSCNPNAGCQSLPNQATCVDDGNACTSDVCAAGACYAPKIGKACDDGDPCTIDDVCTTGTCQGKPTFWTFDVPTMGSPGDAPQLNSLRPSSAGGWIAAGFDGDSSVVVRINDDGALLWLTKVPGFQWAVRAVERDGGYVFLGTSSVVFLDPAGAVVATWPFPAGISADDMTGVLASTGADAILVAATGTVWHIGADGTTKSSSAIGVKGATSWDIRRRAKGDFAVAVASYPPKIGHLNASGSLLETWAPNTPPEFLIELRMDLWVDDSVALTGTAYGYWIPGNPPKTMVGYRKAG